MYSVVSYTRGIFAYSADSLICSSCGSWLEGNFKGKIFSVFLAVFTVWNLMSAFLP